MMQVAPIILFITIAGLSDAFIITRHDTPDDAYIAFAENLPVTPAVVKYNATDVAGTLIAPRWILSAAHVAETLEPGHSLLIADGDSLEVEKVVLHPGWIENGRPEDIALIRLVRPVSDATPVDLYEDFDELGQEVIIVGNGDFGTGVTGPKGNDGLMRAATNLVDEATEYYLKWRFDDPRDRGSLVKELEGISGPGDSGGPAFIQVDGTYFIAGISSGQSTKETGGKEGRYGVIEYYARVSTYRDWIDEVVSND